jgi:hypothetical protein
MIAFTTQASNVSKPIGMPNEWPYQEMTISDDHAAYYQSLGWNVLSADQYVLYKATYQSAYDAWLSTQPTQFLADKEKYQRRAAAKDSMIAEMAAGNMSRVRAGTWSVADLVALMADDVIKAILNDLSTLSFELAYAKVDTITNPIVTTQIKTSWKTLLASNFYN